MEPRARIESGLEAHCRRVAAVAVELGRALGLAADELTRIESAALAHHAVPPPLGPAAMDRLLSDVLDAAAAGAEAGVEPDIEPAPLEAQIVEAANLFAERIEFLPYEYQTGEQIVDELAALAREGALHHSIPGAFDNLLLARREDIPEVLQQLPVFPMVALEALELASDPDASFTDIERIVGADQVLAGALIRAANCCLYAAVQPISTIRHAVSYVGLDRAREVIMAAVFRPLFLTPTLRPLWKHSLEVARLAERLAARTPGVNSGEAYLAGLVHDAGRLILTRLPGRIAKVYAGLLERGCEPVVAELALMRFDHAEAGAVALGEWLFPPALIEAVRHHHEPERTASPLASILYVAEYWSASEEDLPSLFRLQHALDLLRLTLEEVKEVDAGAAPQDGALLAT